MYGINVWTRDSMAYRHDHSPLPIITLPMYITSLICQYILITKSSSSYLRLLTMSFIATWIPIRKIKNIRIADVLRFEA